ncbi:MAG: glycosyltransferase [Bacteroidales bacterium]|nr:glycosyltransferase [Bacteroidales bacterium]
MYKALAEANVEVDLLTKYPVEGHPEFLFVNHKESIWDKVKNKIRHKLLKPKAGYYFFYKKEIHPPMPVKKVLAKISKPYDMVCVLFWQGLLSFMTIDAIYDKLRCTFLFICADYSPMAGGCHFTCSCEKYRTGCGECEALGSHDKNDFTAWNVRYRKKVYDKVKPIVGCNSYMMQFFNRSYLLKDVRKEIIYPVINTEIFKPLNRSELIAKHNIDKNKKFIVFLGCQSLSDSRKGIGLLIEALKLFHSQMSEDERNGVLLICAGKNFSTIEPMLPFESKDFGFVGVEMLPELFSLADVFLCPSVYDAGPMMVNQSLCCGTPVVGFEMGSCLHVVKDCGTGYCAKVGDVDDFAKGVNWIYNLSYSDKEKLRTHCRNFGAEHHSYQAFAKKILEL